MRKAKKNKKKKKILRKIILVFEILYIFFYIGYIIVFHSPYTYLRDLWVTTAMSTMSHQWLAYMFVSPEDIAKIMNANKVLKPAEKINLDNIDIPVVNKTTDIDSNTPKDSDMNKIDYININGNNYKGNLLIIHDPSKVYLGLSKNIGFLGEKLLDMTKRYNAVAGINAGGFSDPNGNGNGGHALGLTICNGKIITKPEYPNDVDLVGFTYDHKLIIGNYTMSQIKKLNIKDAVSFCPQLIINSTPTTIRGDGGWGIQPRTCIGQRKDGAVLMLTIDGRQLHSIGASIKEEQNIMLEYGAVNACNLDGGSSSTMVYNNKIVNHPCSKYGPRYLPNAFLVKK